MKPRKYFGISFVEKRTTLKCNYGSPIKFMGCIWRPGDRLWAAMVELSNIDSYDETLTPLFCTLNLLANNTTNSVILQRSLRFPLESHKTDSVFLGCNQIATALTHDMMASKEIVNEN